MIKLKRIISILFIICLLLSMCGLTAYATGGNLPDSFFIDDENGTSVTDSGEYLFYMENIMPGDVLTRTITLRNLEQGDPFTLHMREEPISTTGPVDWLDNLYMVITLDDREIYSGRVRGDGKDTHTMKGNGSDELNSGIYLREFNKGEYAVLKFVITVDANHLSSEDYKESSEARTRLIFNAVKNVGKDANPPKTGEIVKYGLCFLFLLLIILCVVFYYRYRKLRRIVE